MSTDNQEVTGSLPPKAAEQVIAAIPRKKPIAAEVPGVMSEFWGTGAFAKETFVGLVILASFACGIAGSIAVFIISGCRGNFVEDLRGVWNIFVPLITLALGYAFGKLR